VLIAAAVITALGVILLYAARVESRQERGAAMPCGGCVFVVAAGGLLLLAAVLVVLHLLV
jgi:hypothetical protein